MAKKLTYTRYIGFIDRAKKGKHPSTKHLRQQFEISQIQSPICDNNEAGIRRS